MKKFLFKTYWEVYGKSEVNVPDDFTIEQAEEYVRKHFEEFPLPRIDGQVDYSWEPDFEGSTFEYSTKLNFADDEEKMTDFYALSKEEFLKSYSYITEQEYEATKDEVSKIQA